MFWHKATFKHIYKVIVYTQDRNINNNIVYCILNSIYTYINNMLLATRLGFDFRYVLCYYALYPRPCKPGRVRFMANSADIRFA